MSKIIPRLVMCRGLPGSGKSSWSSMERARLEANHLKCQIVNKDDIRKGFVAHGWVWSQENEKQIITRRDDLIKEAFEVGYHVVISSDCNFGKHPKRLEELARLYKADFEIKDFTDVDVLTCCSRDAQRPEDQRVGPAVIKMMYAKYLAMPELVPYIPDPNKPKTLICDLDGTVALSKGVRSPFDYANVGKDKPNIPVIEIVKGMFRADYTVIYMSGREDSCREASLDWIYRMGLPKGPLFMRKTGDYRKDYIIKQELFDRHVRDHYNVMFCLDDRLQVLRLWQKLGICTLAVGNLTEF